MGIELGSEKDVVLGSGIEEIETRSDGRSHANHLLSSLLCDRTNDVLPISSVHSSDPSESSRSSPTSSRSSDVKPATKRILPRKTTFPFSPCNIQRTKSSVEASAGGG